MMPHCWILQAAGKQGIGVGLGQLVYGAPLPSADPPTPHSSFVGQVGVGQVGVDQVDVGPVDYVTTHPKTAPWEVTRNP